MTKILLVEDNEMNRDKLSRRLPRLLSKIQALLGRSAAS
jgi:hypothetical protein